jgi:uncharacterized protein
VVIVQNEIINEIPVLHVVQQDRQLTKLPSVIFIHGFTSAKEHNLHYAYLLAENGFRVLLPDTIYHGEREQNGSEVKLTARFWEIVIQTLGEIDILKNHYVHAGLVDENRIGLAGTSMGGIVTLGALKQYSWIKSAVSLMGMPAYEQFSYWQLDQMKKHGISIPFTEDQIADQLMILRDYDLSQQPEALMNRPLLFWHAKNDPMVPYSLTYQFYQAIQSDYEKKNPENLCFISDERAGHKVTREGLKATVDWFKKYL